jgi:ATP-dependent RNA helicase HelY
MIATDVPIVNHTHDSGRSLIDFESIPRTFRKRSNCGEAVGRRLTRIFAERDLLVSEVIRRGVFSSLSATDVTALLSGLLFESRSEERQLPRIPKSLAEAVRDVVGIWAEISDLEEEYGLDTQHEPDFSMAWSIGRWASGSTLSKVLRESDVTAGDFVRHVKQIIDLLGQLIEADPEESEKYRSALSGIDRGVIRLANIG